VGFEGGPDPLQRRLPKRGFNSIPGNTPKCCVDLERVQRPEKIDLAVLKEQSSPEPAKEPK